MANYRTLLSRPPLRRTRLLELRPRWAGLAGARARLAELLRVFVVTWDPLELDGERPPAFGTANSGELCVYIPFWRLEELAERRDADAADVLGWLGGCAVVVAEGHEEDVTAGRYARLVASGEAPDLLSAALADLTGQPPLGRPEAIVAVGGWGEIGLGMITDVVQQAYGPVDLDRSKVELASLPAPRPGCPACAGRRFGFPADLNDQAEQFMCDPHRKEAVKVTRQRLARAEQSNRAGWNAIASCSIRLQKPVLPRGLASQVRARIAQPGPELVALLAEAWQDFAGEPEEFYLAIGEEPAPSPAGRLPRPPRALQTLVADLAAAGLFADALQAADTLANIEPLYSTHWYGDSLAAVAVALAAGAIDGDRAEFQARLVTDLCPASASVQLHAGDVYQALGRPDAALEAYEKARSLAVAQADAEVRRAVASRIAALSGEPEAPARQVIRAQHRSHPRGRRRR